ncbi:hypothetical protein LSAT2_011045 [Lamellibrachia satsuma]|nr:hypothetical protein LSAT2_011045 [Lamellibrachia satsuma]
MRHCASALASFPRRDLCIVGPVLDATAQLGRSVATWTCARGFVLWDVAVFLRNVIVYCGEALTFYRCDKRVDVHLVVGGSQKGRGFTTARIGLPGGTRACRSSGSVMVAEQDNPVKMQVGNLPEDVLLANRALWLKHEQLSYMQKSRLKRQLGQTRHGPHVYGSVVSADITNLASDSHMHIQGNEMSRMQTTHTAMTFRDATTAPLRKLSVDLIKTYKHINEVFVNDRPTTWASAMPADFPWDKVND